MAVYYTYMVVCSDQSLYTGYTDDLVRRMRKHNSGRGAKYTRSRLPVRLVYWEKYPSKRQAMQREYAIKQWTRRQKLRLLQLSADAPGGSSWAQQDEGLSLVWRDSGEKEVTERLL